MRSGSSAALRTLIISQISATHLDNSKLKAIRFSETNEMHPDSL